MLESLDIRDFWCKTLCPQQLTWLLSLITIIENVLWIYALIKTTPRSLTPTSRQSEHNGHVFTWTKILVISIALCDFCFGGSVFAYMSVILMSTTSNFQNVCTDLASAVFFVQNTAIYSMLSMITIIALLRLVVICLPHSTVRMHYYFFPALIIEGLLIYLEIIFFQKNGSEISCGDYSYIIPGEDEHHIYIIRATVIIVSILVVSAAYAFLVYRRAEVRYNAGLSVDIVHMLPLFLSAWFFINFIAVIVYNIGPKNTTTRFWSIFFLLIHAIGNPFIALMSNRYRETVIATYYCCYSRIYTDFDPDRMSLLMRRSQFLTLRSIDDMDTEDLELRNDAITLYEQKKKYEERNSAMASQRFDFLAGENTPSRSRKRGPGQIPRTSSKFVYTLAQIAGDADSSKNLRTPRTEQLKGESRKKRRTPKSSSRTFSPGSTTFPFSPSAKSSSKEVKRHQRHRSRGV